MNDGRPRFIIVEQSGWPIPDGWPDVTQNHGYGFHSFMLYDRLLDREVTTYRTYARRPRKRAQALAELHLARLEAGERGRVTLDDLYRDLDRRPEGRW